MEQLGYIALGCVLMLAAARLRRVNWSKIRFPKLDHKRLTFTPRTWNSALLSIAVHVALVFICALFIATKDVDDVDYEIIRIEWVKVPPPLRRIKTPDFKPIQPRIVPQHTPSNRSFYSVEPNDNLSLDTSQPRMGDFQTTAEVVPKPNEVVVSPRTGESGRDTLTGSAAVDGRGSAYRKDRGGLGTTIESTGTEDLASLADADFSHEPTVPDNELGAILTGKGRDISAHIRLIRLKHSLSDWWQDPTAMPSLFKWLRKNTRIRADMKFKAGSLRLTDPEIQKAPLIFMTGHDKDIALGRSLAKDGPLSDGFSPAERAALRKYIIERDGTFFFDDCGFNGLFAQQVALEFGRIFPEYPLKDIPHNHEIYKLRYELPVPPKGGDVFWSAPGAAQRVGGVYQAVSSKFAYQKGISIGSRLAVIYNRKDYMCSMETAEVDSRARLRNRRSTDVHKFMTNLMVYILKYGGNVDRSRYKR